MMDNALYNHRYIRVRPPSRPWTQSAARRIRMGDVTFLRRVAARRPWLIGGMAHGVTSARMVEAAARGGVAAFYGAAGVELERVDQALRQLARVPGPVGVNLAHHVGPERDDQIVDLALEHGIRRLEASSFIRPNAAVIRYRLAGLTRDACGGVRARNIVIAKASRAEVARRWFAPAPERVVCRLLAAGAITPEQARLAREVPLADAVTAEGHSGGHTDGRPLLAVLPGILAARDEARARGLTVWAGAAGGLGTPATIAAAFVAGADYTLAGSVLQGCVESGASRRVKQLLAAAGPADTALVPSPVLFETGARVQVLTSGTRFPQNARRLEQLWRAHGSLEELPARDRQWFERTILHPWSAADVWAEIVAWCQAHGPQLLESLDPRGRFALYCRWYLASAARWALEDDAPRDDVQVWCGPAMGTFNEWARGGPLERAEARTTMAVSRALLDGAAGLLGVPRATPPRVRARVRRAPPRVTARARVEH